MDVPPEILSMVCKSLTKTKLMTFRLTCKACDRAAVPLLFNEVFLSTMRGDFETAQLTTSQFGPYIKTLIFSSVYFSAISWSEFKRRTMKQRRGGSKEPNIDHHLRLGYRNYCRLHTEQKADLEMGICMAHLVSALQSMPSLERLVLRDIGASEPLYVSSAQLGGRAFWEGGEVCVAQGCNLSAKEHLQYQLRLVISTLKRSPIMVSYHTLCQEHGSSQTYIHTPPHGQKSFADIQIRCSPKSGYLKSIANPWDLAMLALWSTKSSTKAISTECEPCSQSLPIWSFNMSRPYLLCDLFRNLTEIRLVIGNEHNEADSHCIRDRRIAKTLSAASQLRILQLSLNQHRFYLDGEPEVTPFDAMLGDCHFVKLEACEFTQLNSTTEELVNFLQASTGLKRLYLVDHRLTAGTWESAAYKMRACLNLEDVKLCYLSGGWTRSDLDLEEWRYNAKAVREFFLKSGCNPFSDAALNGFEYQCQETGHGCGMSDSESSDDDRGEDDSSEDDSSEDDNSDDDNSRM